MSVQIIVGNSAEALRDMPDKSVHCVITSPPYFNLRDYGIAGQIGLEHSLSEYIAKLVEVFREVRRVLRDDGTLWLNIGDSYANDSKWGGTTGGKHAKALHDNGSIGRRRRSTGLQSKETMGVPWMLAFALRADGWLIRQDIIWNKPNPQPEPVKDRCTRAHEYLFLLTKRGRYYFDVEAIAEPSTCFRQRGSGARFQEGTGRNDAGDRRSEQGRITYGKRQGAAGTGGEAFVVINAKRNKRSVWTVPTEGFSEAHFAVFPAALIEDCVKAGCPELCCSKCGAAVVRKVVRKPMVIARSERTHELGQYRASGTMLKPGLSETIGFEPSCKCDAAKVPGVVLDPFGGAGTTALVADRLQRDSILLELNPEYAALAERRIHGDASLFAEVKVA